MLFHVKNTDSIEISIINYHQNANENELFFMMKMHCANDDENENRNTYTNAISKQRRKTIQV